MKNLKTKSLLTMSLILSGAMVSLAQTGWSWAKGYGGNSNESGYAVATDNAGNIITSAGFASGTITVGTTTATCKGRYDALVYKSDASGNPIWAKSIGGTGWDRLLSIKTDASGNIYAAGTFDSPTLDVDGTILTCAGSSDMFVVKFDQNGNVLWAKSGGGTGEDHSSGLAVDASGNVYVTGHFKSATFTANSASLTNAYSPAMFSDIFLVKYDTDGNIQWAKSQDAGGGMQHEYAYAVTADASGDIIVAVDIPQPLTSITFGSDVVNATQQVLVKYDTDGNVRWAKGKVLGYFTTSKIAHDADDNLFVSGRFIGTHPNPAIHAYLTVAGDTIPPIGEDDIFLIKYNSSGTVVWAKSYGGDGMDGINSEVSIAVDAAGDVYMGTTSLSDVIHFGSFSIGSGGIVAAKISGNDGNGIRAHLAHGNAGGMQCSGIALDADANAFVTGWFNGFDPVFGAVTFPKPGKDDDIYLAKVGDGVSSVKNVTAQLQIPVHPNPANEFVTVSDMPTGSTLKVVDITGKTVYNAIPTHTSAIINTQNFVPGIYLIHIENKGNVVHKKLVISR